MSNMPRASFVPTRLIRRGFGLGRGFLIVGCLATLHSLKQPATESDDHKPSMSAAENPMRESLPASVLAPPKRSSTTPGPVTLTLSETNCSAGPGPQFVMHKRIEDAPAWAIRYSRE